MCVWPISVMHLSVVRKWVQQSQVWMNLAGESHAILINFSISAILLVRLNHLGIFGMCGEPQCIGIHILATLIRCTTRDLRYACTATVDWWRINLAGVCSKEYVEICIVNSWTCDQNCCCSGYDHQICNKVLGFLEHLQHLLEMFGSNVLINMGVRCQRVKIF